jgi:acyl-CoA synthetase (AMP-forming)/AMP-acid ligase II
MSLSIARLGALWGNRPAVFDGDATVTYAELADRAADAARRLRAMGVERGDAVAVVSRNRVELLVLFFAAHRLGAVFAPVPHRLTPATVGPPVERIDPAVVVHEAAQRDLVRAFDAHSFEEFRHVTPATDESDQPSDVPGPDPDDPLLFLTTEEGVVAFSTRAVRANCAAAVAGWGLGRDDCTATLLPLSDADGLLRFVLPLLGVGGRVVCQRAFDPEEALAVVESRGVTCATGGATEFRELANADADDLTDTDWSSVEWLATRTRVPSDVCEAFPVPLVRAYGRPVVGPNVLRGTPARPDGGRPFPDCDVRLRGEETTEEPNADGELAASEVGELLVRAPTTASGSLGGDGFGERDSGAWVPTGDLFRRDGDDFLLVGRTDEVFESGGRRVHPRRVETLLETHSEVEAAGVVAAADETGGTAPKAVVVGDAEPGALREFAEVELSAHEVPGAVEVVASLPRQPSGELDRATLRERFGTR